MVRAGPTAVCMGPLGTPVQLKVCSSAAWRGPTAGAGREKRMQLPCSFPRTSAGQSTAACCSRRPCASCASDAISPQPHAAGHAAPGAQVSCARATGMTMRVCIFIFAAVGVALIVFGCVLQNPPAVRHHAACTLLTSTLLACTACNTGCPAMRSQGIGACAPPGRPCTTRAPSQLHPTCPPTAHGAGLWARHVRGGWVAQPVRLAGGILGQVSWRPWCWCWCWGRQRECAGRAARPGGKGQL